MANSNPVNMNNPFNFKQQNLFVLRLFLLMTIIEVVNLLSGRLLNQFALVPRNWDGLWGILIAPFLHGNLWHFSSNILPLCLFSWLAMYYGKRCFWQASLWILITTGILVWLFARDAMHLGASGIVYGYFGFLLLAGFLSGRFRMMLLSLVVGFFYGGLILGVLPVKAYISWESHLFGFIAGLMAAYLFVQKQQSEKHKI
ncbi:MAG: rhomboid family intramembrane serine protease [Aestuariibacter sp.]